MNIDNNKISIHLNGNLEGKIILNSNYTEDLGTFYSFIGCYGIESEYFQGFVWSFLIFYNEAIIQSDYVGGLYNDGNCLVEKCENSCNPSFITNGIS